jgi:hypothetical protein
MSETLGWLAHPFGRINLGQSQCLHGLSDLDHQARFDVEFFCVGQTQVS